MTNLSAPDFTVHPPRSVRVRLGGYAHLPRLLDKARASAAEIEAWSDWLVRNGPGGSDGHQWMATTITAAAPDRDDIRGFADLLDLDDYVSFGGRG